MTETKTKLKRCPCCGGKLDMPKHDCDLDLLSEQLNAMGHYIHVLEIRAEIEHIDL